MLNNQRTVNHDGTDYIITLFKASQGLGIKAQLVKIAAPLIASADGQSKGTDINLQSIATAITNSLDRGEIVSLSKELLSQTYKGSQPINFDIEFAGRYHVMYALIKDVLEFNYSSVFQALGSHTN